MKGLTDEELMHLGRVAIASAELENTLDMMIGFNLRPEITYALVERKTIGPKLELLKKITLPRLRSASRIKHFKGVMTVLTKLISQRNVAIHGLWSPGGSNTAYLSSFLGLPDPRPVAASSGKKELKVSASELKDLAEDLLIFDYVLKAFHKNVWVSPMMARMRRREEKRREAKEKAVLLAKYAE